MLSGTQRNKRLVLDYVRAMSSDDPEGPFRYVSPEFRMSGGSLTGDRDLSVEEARRWRQAMLEAFPDLKFNVGSQLLVAEDDTVAVRMRWTGTHMSEFRGVPATGRKIDLCFFAFFRVREGLIDRETHLTDCLAVMEQILGRRGPSVFPQATAMIHGLDPPRLPTDPSERFFVPSQDLPEPWWVEKVGPRDAGPAPPSNEVRPRTCRSTSGARSAVHHFRGGMTTAPNTPLLAAPAHAAGLASRGSVEPKPGASLDPLGT